MAQLSEADVQGHCAGGTSPAAHTGGGGGGGGYGSGYSAALGEAASGLAQLAREMDSRTTLLILADHGSADHGGSGGTEPQATHEEL